MSSSSEKVAKRAESISSCAESVLLSGKMSTPTLICGMVGASSSSAMMWDSAGNIGLFMIASVIVGR